MLFYLSLQARDQLLLRFEAVPQVLVLCLRLSELLLGVLAIFFDHLEFLGHPEMAAHCFDFHVNFAA